MEYFVGEIDYLGLFLVENQVENLYGGFYRKNVRGRSVFKYILIVFLSIWIIQVKRGGNSG